MPDIVGTDFDDILNGTPMRDVINGLAGDDEIFGRRGDDDLYGNRGADVLNGGSGFDYVLYHLADGSVSVDLTGYGSGSEAEGDSYIGIEGIIGSRYGDTLTGDDADNVIYTQDGPDTVHGKGGNDYIGDMESPNYFPGGEIVPGMSFLYGDAGDDTITGWYSESTIYGGVGDDEIYYGHRVFGGGGNDYVYGGSYDSVIRGGSGNDRIEATYGSHTVYGGTGKDLVWTEGLYGGEQTVYLQGGGDTGAYYGYNNAAFFDGGDGLDTFIFDCLTAVSGWSPRVKLDVLDGVKGEALSIGFVEFQNFESYHFAFNNDANDILRLGRFDDYADCGMGDDSIWGRGGNDILSGWTSNAHLFGGAGDDVLLQGTRAKGNSGNDVLWSLGQRAGNFSGGAGADVIGVLAGWDVRPDNVVDFDATEDRIALYFSRPEYIDLGHPRFHKLMPRTVEETPEYLEFSYRTRFGESGSMHTETVHYDQTTGVLSHLFYGRWAHILTLENAPDLTMDSFLRPIEII